MAWFVRATVFLAVRRDRPLIVAQLGLQSLLDVVSPGLNRLPNRQAWFDSPQPPDALRCRSGSGFFLACLALHSVYDKVCFGAEGSSTGLHHAVDLWEDHGFRTQREIALSQETSTDLFQTPAEPDFLLNIILSFLSQFFRLGFVPMALKGQAIRLDLHDYEETRGTRYCGFDPYQSQWISVIFLAFSLSERGIVLPRSVGYNVFVPWAPPDSKNRSKPADRIKWFTYYVNSSFINLFTPFQYTNDTAFRFYK